MYIFPNGMIWKEGALAVFGGYHGLGRSAGECVERQPPQPGEDRGGEVPHAAKHAKPPAALLTGGVSELATPRWADGVPGGPPLACARAWRSTQAAADSDSPLHPVVPARDPPSPASWLAPRSTCGNARVIATTQPRSWPGAAAGRLGGLTWRLGTRLWLTAKGTMRGARPMLSRGRMTVPCSVRAAGMRAARS